MAYRWLYICLKSSRFEAVVDCVAHGFVVKAGKKWFGSEKEAALDAQLDPPQCIPWGYRPFLVIEHNGHEADICCFGDGSRYETAI